MIAAVVVVLAAGVLGWGLRYFWLVAPTGCAYKAKALCSLLFVSGRDVDCERAPEVSAEAYKIMRLFPAKVDRSRRTVTVSFHGLRAKTAVCRPGLGATLLADGALWQPEAPIPEPPGGEDPWPEPAKQEPALERFLDLAFAERDPKRLCRTRAALVLKDGKILAERYAPGFSKASRLPGWSVTKAVIGALVGVLVKEGKLSLDQDRLFPEWSGKADTRAKIRLEDLLRMRSGLLFAEKYSNPLSDVNTMLWNSRDAAAYAASRPLAAEPGTVWQYSSGTTNLLSRLVRRAVGERDYPRFPRRALFDPVDMKSALMEPDASGTFVGSSFMFATARDWARFGELYRLDGVWEGRRILPEGWVKLCTTPTPQSPDGRYGAHWWLKLQPEIGGETEYAARIPADAFFAIGHEGQTITVIPSRGLVAVRLGLSIDIWALNHARFVAELLEALA